MITPTAFAESHAYTCGAQNTQRSIAERLRARATHVQQLSEHFPSSRRWGYTMLATELRRLADELEEIP